MSFSLLLLCRAGGAATWYKVTNLFLSREGGQTLAWQQSGNEVCQLPVIAEAH